MTPENVIYRDALDVLFEDRNKAYGAYQLRREYPKYLRNALLLTLLGVLLLFAAPYFFASMAGVFAAKEQPIDVIAELGPPPDIDPNTPPPPPPPPVETPPPPTRTTVAFVPPVVKKDVEVQEEEPKKSIEELQEIKADIGKDDKQGNDDAPPEVIDNPSELEVVEAPKAPPAPDKTYEMFDIQKPPSFPGGEAELLKYLAKNIEYPALARENNIQGVVALTFVVNKDGSISEVRTVKDIGGGCGKEAERVVKNMPRWSAGEANGNPVKVRFTLPVRFKLE
jgi:protein TonB